VASQLSAAAVVLPVRQHGLDVQVGVSIGRYRNARAKSLIEQTFESMTYSRPWAVG